MEGPAKNTALITGASEGIGQELSRIFAREGYDLVLVARNEEKLNSLAEELSKRFGISSRVIAKDLSKKAAADEIFKELDGSGVRIDTLVNNAGFTVYGAFAESEFAAQEQMLDVLIYAPTRLTRLFLPGMIEKGGGKVLNLASTGSFVPCPYEAVYAAAKAYMLFFSEAIAEELVGNNVTVTALCPGATSTRFFERSDTEDIKALQVARMAADQVAEIGYRALVAKKHYVVPGMPNKALVLLTRVMPRRLLCRVTRFAMS